MANGRRTTGGLLFVGAGLLAAVAATVWFLLRPVSPVVHPMLHIDELDIVCTGRVDAAMPVRSLDPSTPGRVVAVYVVEGAAVKAGAPVLKIDDRPFQDAVRDAQSAKQGAEIEYDMAKFKADSQPSEMEAAQLKIDAAGEQVVGLQAKLKQTKEQTTLSAAVPVTPADIEVMEANIRGLRKQIAGDQARLTQLRKADVTLEVRAAKLRLDAADEAIRRATRMIDDCTVRAPSDGTILRLQAAVGGTIAPGNPLTPAVVFAPAGPFIVRAEMEQSSLGRVAIGMKVILRDDTRPDAPTTDGKVTQIAGWVAQKRSILLDPGEYNDVRTTEVIVAFETPPERLWIGQRMQARIVRGE